MTGSGFILLYYTSPIRPTSQPNITVGIIFSLNHCWASSWKYYLISVSLVNRTESLNRVNISVSFYRSVFTSPLSRSQSVIHGRPFDLIEKKSSLAQWMRRVTRFHSWHERRRVKETIRLWGKWKKIRSSFVKICHSNFFLQYSSHEFIQTCWSSPEWRALQHSDVCFSEINSIRLHSKTSKFS